MKLVQHRTVGRYVIVHGGRARLHWIVLGPLPKERGIRPTVAHGSFVGRDVTITQGVVGASVLQTLRDLAQGAP